MAVTGVIHHIGTFLLFAATILLIITNITAPVVHNISLLRVDLDSGSAQGQAVTFGTYGYCNLGQRSGLINERTDSCSPSMVGYSPAQVIEDATTLRYNSAAEDTARALTKVMILHPIATAIAFIAFMLSLGAGMVGSLLSSMVALLAFVVTLIVLITDFVLFGIVRAGVNENSRSTGATAEFGSGLWTALVAAVCLFLGTIIVFFTCCSARRHRRRDVRTTKVVDGYAPPPRRRRWF